MTWYEGAFLGKMLSTCGVNLAGKYFGMSPRPWGLAQGLQRRDDMRRRASAPGISEGRSKRRSLASRGGVQGPTARTFVGVRPVDREFDLEDLGGRVSLRLTDGGSRYIHPLPVANGEVWDRMQCVGEGGVDSDPPESPGPRCLDHR